MATYSTNQFKPGLKIMLDGQPCSIIENLINKPGKGQATNKVKYRNLITGRVLDKTFKSGDKVEAADVIETEMTYLYGDGSTHNFMDPKTFDQHEIAATAMEEAAKWIKPEDICIITLWDGQSINVTPPTFVELKITQSDPGLRGDTTGKVLKPATLETGVVVQVPYSLNLTKSSRSILEQVNIIQE